jgi:hypothetical protein
LVCATRSPGHRDADARPAGRLARGCLPAIGARIDDERARLDAHAHLVDRGAIAADRHARRSGHDIDREGTIDAQPIEAGDHHHPLVSGRGGTEEKQERSEGEPVHRPTLARL